MKISRRHRTSFGANAPFVEELYERYLADPASVAPEWRQQFDAWQAGAGAKDVRTRR
jgi:2-oxoglutarate dehydrogenase E1 component